MKKTHLILICSIMTTILLSSEHSAWDNFFKKVDYGKPFVSEMYSTMNKLEMGYDKNYDEYNIQEEVTKLDRPVVVVDLGINIPLYSNSFGTINGTQKPKWSFSLSYPVSIHILEDMFEAITAPLINTDFNFGGPEFDLIRNFSGKGFIKNISLTWLPYHHQCTHLGDEIIIYRTQAKLPITRVNISYYYTDLKLTINDPDGSKENLNSFRIGIYYRLTDHGYGWFSIREGVEETETIDIKHSENRAEYYFDYRYQRSSGFMASKTALNIISFEARNRVRLNHPIFKEVNGVWTTKEIQENHKWSFNLYLGWKFFHNENDNRGVGLFLRAYSGLNPYGELRNNTNYRFLGVSLTYDL